MLACVDGDHVAFDDGRLFGGGARLSGFCPDPHVLRLHLYGLGLGVHDAHELVRRRFQIRFPIQRLRALVGGPWPVLEVRWRERGREDRRVFGLSWSPRASWSPAPEERAAERAVLELLRFAERHRWPGLRVDGWWNVPDVPWERAADLPASGAGYRRLGEPVIARAPGVLGWRRVLAWNRRPREAAPEQLVLTADHLYARFQGGQVGRVPRGALRRRVDDGRFTLFLFGRATSVVMERGCPVAAPLDAQLARNVRWRR